MSVDYRAISWNPFKKRFDIVFVAGLGIAILAFVGFSFITADPGSVPRPEAVVIRALGAVTIFMLHAVLWIGPLARLHRRFLPALYNRRHMGVTTFFLALLHALLSLGYYHGFGIVNPFVSLATFSAGPVPFEWLGAAALLILFLLAATSHDFWNRTLGPVGWKWLHMAIYPAYACAVLHVLTGSASEQPTLRTAIFVGMAITCTLHLAAGLKSARHSPALASADSGWTDIAPRNSVVDGTVRNINLKGGHAVALCGHEGQVFAVGGRCVHQGGPLGEGKIIDGCLTCPWHGWQYRPQDGASPPPFTEQLPIYQVRVVDDRIQIRPSTPTNAPPQGPVSHV
ncbi:MAG: Rieske (2Fe-2S) protein [bacterium]|nr:Rieske (2Fe-2S) protein [bacterium]